MSRGVIVAAVWILAIVMVVLSIGQRVYVHRMMDPVRVLRAWLPWVPDDFRDCAQVRINHQGNGQVEVQIEIHGEPEQIRRFAKRNGFVDSDISHSNMAVESWTLGDRAPSGLIVQMLLPSDGGPALLTVLGNLNKTQ